MTNTQVLIIGAGPTGLALALWLTRLAVSVRIIDKAAEPGTTSRALAVQVRTLEFYRQLGLADSLIEGGVEIAGLNFWVKGDRPLGCRFNASAPEETDTDRAILHAVQALLSKAPEVNSVRCVMRVALTRRLPGR
jgi:2-polyprenyl-6-methoxyphenol hydroxylase-like FAD-dependent oxidoreductase